MTDWDRRFHRLAAEVSGWSKDPSSKVGAVVAQGKTEVGLGFNGPPPVVDDEWWLSQARETRLAITLHAEDNALHKAGAKAEGASLYVWPFSFVCTSCAARIIRAGIKRIVLPGDPVPLRWHDEWALAKRALSEAGIEVVYI